MIDTLFQFTNTDLCSASLALLDKLGMKYTRGAEESLKIYDLFNGKSTPEALDSVTATYFVALIDERTFENSRKQVALDTALDEAFEEKYKGIFVFAIDVKPEANLTRTMAATLTRAFNRLAVNKPVVLFIRQSETLSIATCERSNYAQTWREGEKIGKVSVLRGINCKKPHPGHINTLMMLQAPTTCNSFSLLHEHWKEVFSTELLTKKFYTELSDWYAWAIQVIRFPNHLGNEIDNKKYNAENGIRLVTRLIFVWFLKQKKLIPEAFFDQNSLKQIIKDFDPTQKEHSLFGYMSRESKYYKAILQNLFFAMLNCPLTEEGRNEVNVRGFRKYDEDGKATGSNRGDSKLMRYKYYFKDPDAFVEMANSVPFLNGGLFDCLDDPDQSLYFDGFSDNEKVSKALCVPDYLFFGERENIDLSEWYDDQHKGHIKVRGIIDILKSYQFTIEENTPYEQEVSLDPELLGKVFENLLASYNPETNKTARKSTGSYYTPREIVQYMVTESLVAYLKEKVGEDLEPQYRQLLDYSETDVKLNPEQKQQIMRALYQCKVLDPACGSGAFPMGMLQQMVHVLSQLDPNNNSWKNLVLEQSGEELAKSLDHDEEERKELQADINRSFDLSQNYPDYARKLYLIENCIYGVDIQTIAIQISKLRCFITLVVDQKVSTNPADNFGIRPLPNLEARFVAANTLIGLGKDLSLANTDNVQCIKDKLAEANHRIFNAKTMRTKRKWREKVKELRKDLSNELIKTGMLSNDDATLIASWDMFDQNTSSNFFDSEWMFGLSNGFDIVIENPPYIDSETMTIVMPEMREKYAKLYECAKGNWDIYIAFMEFSLKNSKIAILITPDKWLSKPFGLEFRKRYLINRLTQITHAGAKVFSSATVDAIISLYNEKTDVICGYKFTEANEVQFISKAQTSSLIEPYYIDFLFSKHSSLISKIDLLPNKLKNLGVICENACATKDFYIVKDLIESNDNPDPNQYYKLINTGTIEKYGNKWFSKEISYGGKFKFPVVNKVRFNSQLGKSYKKRAASSKIIFKGLNLLDGCLDENAEILPGKTTFVICSNNILLLKFLLGLLNSKLPIFYIKTKYASSSYCGGITFSTEMINYLPVPLCSLAKQPIITLVDKILAAKKSAPQTDTTTLERKIDVLVYLLYGLTWDEVQVVENSSVHAALPVNEVAYTKWLERYQKDGTLPSEEEMEHMA
jgi:type I restriction-modification system DNA methylase subunit